MVFCMFTRGYHLKYKSLNGRLRSSVPDGSVCKWGMHIGTEKISRIIIVLLMHMKKIHPEVNHQVATETGGFNLSLYLL